MYRGMKRIERIKFMKKQIISFMAFIMILFILGLTDCVLAINQVVEDENSTMQNQLINSTGIESNVQTPGTNPTSNDFVNSINNGLQNLVQKPPKDNRRAVAVTIIIIVTVALIAALVTWYYMTNQ